MWQSVQWLNYGPDDRGLEDQFAAGVRDFSPSQGVRIGPEIHLAVYSVGTGRFFSGVKWPRCEGDHSPPSGAKSTARTAVRQLPYTSTAWCTITRGIL